MTPKALERLFGFVIVGTGITTLYAWIPLVRMVGRPEGYVWRVLDWSGVGASGPWGVFVAASLYAFALLFVSFRGPRSILAPMLVAWHLAVTAIVIVALSRGGSMSLFPAFQRALGSAIPPVVLALPFAAFTVAAVVWVVFDARSGSPREPSPWGTTNTRWLLVSFGLLGLALVLFRNGTNYDAVTSAAIAVTIFHWIALIEAFAATSTRREPSARE